jgi:hypothetical protein
VSRTRLALAGGACLAVALAIGATLPRRRTDAAAALGGFRVLWVDALFLRAERLTRAGRLDEVLATYRKILDLDPASDDAVDFLASIEANDLRERAPTDEGRVRWWNAAMDLVEGGLRATPSSSRLRWRAADLLVAVADADPAVARSLAAAGRDREMEALRHLLAAARSTAGIPRLSHLHLHDLARLSPRLAAERMAKGAPGPPSFGRDVAEALAAGRELALIRAEELSRFPLEMDDETPAVIRLLAGLQLVDRAGKALSASPPDRAAAKRFLEAYRSEYGRDRVAAAMARLVE